MRVSNVSTHYAPVGAIMAYFADDMSSLDSMDWAPCDGRPLLAKGYPELFRALGGSSGHSFRLPDLAGHFLRGTAGRPGKSSPSTTGCPRNPVTAVVPYNPGPGQTHKSRKVASKVASEAFCEYTEEASLFEVENFDLESRPTNVACTWIIKVRPSPYVPVAAVAPFAGRPSRTPGENWSICNGSRIKQETAKKLYRLVKKRFGDAPDPLFCVPNLQGQFLRGIDVTCTQDPDAATRVAADGTVGPRTGTWQDFATGEPQAPFYVWVENYVTDTQLGMRAKGNEVVRKRDCVCLTDECHVGADFYGGDAETRPENICMDYYIQHDMNDGELPIGIIIAFSGAGTPPNPDRWAICDGTAVSTRGPFKYLWEVTGTIHGGRASRGMFNLPDLHNRFIRGTDYSGEDVQGFDPDRFERMAPAPGGSDNGSGSIQDWATARHPEWNIGTVTSSVRRQIAGSAQGNDIVYWDADSVSENELAGGDAETKPLCVDVQFYIKYC